MKTTDFLGGLDSEDDRRAPGVRHVIRTPALLGLVAFGLLLAGCGGDPASRLWRSAELGRPMPPSENDNPSAVQQCWLGAAGCDQTISAIPWIRHSRSLTRVLVDTDGGVRAKHYLHSGLAVFFLCIPVEDEMVYRLEVKVRPGGAGADKTDQGRVEDLVALRTRQARVLQGPPWNLKPLARGSASPAKSDEQELIEELNVLRKRRNRPPVTGFVTPLEQLLVAEILLERIPANCGEQDCQRLVLQDLACWFEFEIFDQWVQSFPDPFAKMGEAGFSWEKKLSDGRKISVKNLGNDCVRLEIKFTPEATRGYSTPSHNDYGDWFQRDRDDSDDRP